MAETGQKQTAVADNQICQILVGDQAQLITKDEGNIYLKENHTIIVNPFCQTG